ncbi:Pyridoxine ECF transporter substrate-specific component PdxU [Paucilactobacillus oligofermentans DSM 15707 = LMG 22743]|nr:ECF transporter S component [Paucilactobacillus oligofermentans]CUS25479.1 Pyridoxine ECF transporter substrate-specific component PdxU [Paucilactobacillus oligofermentans DSM 15707 = LMG 22743]
MSSSYSVRRSVILALMIAITVVVSRIFLIPIPMTHGNVNLCDAGIIIAAIMFGKRDGFIVGALSGFLLDLISGYAQYMFFSLLIHGLEGLIVGWLGYQHRRKTQVLAIIIGIFIMVLGYFITDAILYKPVAGLAGIPANAIQGIIGSIVGYPIALKLKQILKV